MTVTKTRRKNQSKLKRSYQGYNSTITKKGLCHYCETNPIECIDHFPPLSKFDQYKKQHPKFKTGLLIKSCNKCNSVLSDSIQKSLKKRKSFLRHYFQWYKQQPLDTKKTPLLFRQAKKRKEKSLRKIIHQPFFGELHLKLENSINQYWSNKLSYKNICQRYKYQ